MDIKIRFNTEKEKSNPNLPAWRVIINGVEHLAENIQLKAECWTSMDEISPGKFKWHISCKGIPQWDKDKKICTILSAQ